MSQISVLKVFIKGVCHVVNFEITVYMQAWGYWVVSPKVFFSHTPYIQLVHVLRARYLWYCQIRQFDTVYFKDNFFRAYIYSPLSGSGSAGALQCIVISPSVLPSEVTCPYHIFTSFGQIWRKLHPHNVFWCALNLNQVSTYVGIRLCS